jgi:hypothetical protein
MLTLAIDCTNKNLATIITLLKMFLQLLQIIVPIALILLGSLDLGRAVIASDEGAIKKAQKRFINRCLAAVLVFMVAAIVRFTMGFIGNDVWKDCWDKDIVVEQSDDSSNETPTEGVNDEGYKGGKTDDGKTHSSSGGSF